MIRLLLASALVAATTTTALAISRYDTASLSCSRIHAILKSEKTAILRFRSDRGNVLFDAYTSRGGVCTTGGRGRLATVPAADGTCEVIRCVRKRGGGGR